LFGTGTLTPIDYCLELAEGRVASPGDLDIATILDQGWRGRSAAADWKGTGLHRNPQRFHRAQPAF
jgi:hypothetical protein